MLTMATSAYQKSANTFIYIHTYILINIIIIIIWRYKSAGNGECDKRTIHLISFCVLIVSIYVINILVYIYEYDECECLFEGINLASYFVCLPYFYIIGCRYTYTYTCVYIAK